MKSIPYNQILKSLYFKILLLMVFMSMFPCQYSHANVTLYALSFYLISSIVSTASLPLMIINQIFNSLFLFFVLLFHAHFSKT